MKTHIQDIRLKNNSGMRFPVCKANAVTLDLDTTGYPFAPSANQATCKHCIRLYRIRYPWASTK